MADAVVFDTSAFLTLTGDEPGADTVQKFITDAMVGVIDLHASFVSLTEVEYIAPGRRRGNRTPTAGRHQGVARPMAALGRRSVQ